MLPNKPCIYVLFLVPYTLLYQRATAPATTSTTTTKTFRPRDLAEKKREKSKRRKKIPGAEGTEKYGSECLDKKKGGKWEIMSFPFVRVAVTLFLFFSIRRIPSCRDNCKKKRRSNILGKWGVKTDSA